MADSLAIWRVRALVDGAAEGAARAPAVDFIEGAEMDGIEADGVKLARKDGGGGCVGCGGQSRAGGELVVGETEASTLRIEGICVDWWGYHR